MAKVGRPKKLKDISLKEVEKLAALGLTDEEIASWLGICRATLSNYKKQEKEFLDTIKRGKLKSDSNVIKSLYQKALDGDTTAMIFWLKNRRPEEWRDKKDVGLSGSIEEKIIFVEDLDE